MPKNTRNNSNKKQQDEENLYDKSLAYMTLSQLGQADKIFNQILKINPSHIGAIMGKGIIQCDKGNYEEGITLFDKGLAIDSKNIALLRNKAHALELIGDKESANEFYNQAMALEMGGSI
jgi:tetratricopeptide (TPR) repeat protein